MAALDLGDVSERPEVSMKERSLRCQRWTSEMSVKDLPCSGKTLADL